MQEMQALHQDLEDRFLSFNKVVAFNHNPDEVYSPRLYSVLQGASSQVISMMQLLTSELKLYKSQKQEKFHFYYKLLNSEGMLSKQIICPKKDTRRIMAPFQIYENETPKWWKKYNDSKHDLPKGAYQGTIGNVLGAMGALAILHDIAEQAEKMNEPNMLLDGSKWVVYSDDIISNNARLKLKAESDFKSKIFFFLRHFFITS